MLAAPIRGGFDNAAWIVPIAVFLLATAGTFAVVWAVEAAGTVAGRCDSGIVPRFLWPVHPPLRTPPCASASAARRSTDMSPACLPASCLPSCCFAFIFWPERNPFVQADKTRVDYLRERKDAIYENLRDLNFEYLAGKYPEADYAEQRSALEDEAAATIAEMEVADRPRDEGRPLPGIA